MKVYFMSAAPAALFVNGEYAGKTDMFERRLLGETDGEIFILSAPGGGLRPVSFFMDAQFFSSPPECVDVFRSRGEAIVVFRRYPKEDTRLKVIWQTRFNGNLITLFSQGETYLSSEGREYVLKPVGDRFAQVRAEERTLNGFPVLAIYGDGAMLILSHTGKPVFENRADGAEFGEELTVETSLATCTGALAVCSYLYDGEKLTPARTEVRERFRPQEGALHFAFFESVLTGEDFIGYLSPAMAKNAGKIREYLGDIAGVIVPTGDFYERCAEPFAAGLLYKIKDNLFDIKYFAVSYAGGKIDNIYPVE